MSPFRREVPVHSPRAPGGWTEAKAQAPRSDEIAIAPQHALVPAAVEVPPPAAFPVAGRQPTAPVVKGGNTSALNHDALMELWDAEQRSARRKLEPEGALTGATRELQAGLGCFLAICHEHGVKVGPWRLQHVVPEWGFGDHPTYGVVSLAHWACKDGQPWKVGVGLFLARGAGKPKDLEVKLSVMNTEPGMVDHLILLRPEDDLTLSGKSKSCGRTPSAAAATPAWNRRRSTASRSCTASRAGSARSARPCRTARRCPTWPT